MLHFYLLPILDHRFKAIANKIVRAEWSAFFVVSEKSVVFHKAALKFD